MRSFWLARKRNRSVALTLLPQSELKRIDFQIVEDAKPNEVSGGNVRRGSGTCPLCGFTTPIASIRRQLSERHGGTDDARLVCVITTRPGQAGAGYRVPTEQDAKAIGKAREELGVL
jgi:hypothetical protein